MPCGKVQQGKPLGRPWPCRLRLAPNFACLLLLYHQRFSPGLEPSPSHSVHLQPFRMDAVPPGLWRGPRKVEYPTHSHTAPTWQSKALKPNGSQVPVLTTELCVLRTLQASSETSIASGTVSGSGTLGRAGLKPHPHLPPTPGADSGQLPRLSLPHPGALWPPRWSCPAYHDSGPLVQREHCWLRNPQLGFKDDLIEGPGPC